MCAVWSSSLLKAIHNFATPLPRVLHQAQLAYFTYLWLHMSGSILLHLACIKRKGWNKISTGLAISCGWMVYTKRSVMNTNMRWYSL